MCKIATLLESWNERYCRFSDNLRQNVNINLPGFFSSFYIKLLLTHILQKVLYLKQIFNFKNSVYIKGHMCDFLKL